MVKLLISLTLIYSIALAIDIPFLRGLYDPIFPSEWPYYYVNTWSKIWFPIIVFACYTLIFFVGFNSYKTFRNSKKIIFWTIFVTTAFVLHLSYVYFSRFGITVLFQRIVNPGMNGYFSSAVRIETKDYLVNFPVVIEDLDQHARDHPPGSILLIKGVIKVFEELNFSNSIIKFIPIPDGEVKEYWDVLSNAERVSAVFLALFFHLAGAVSIIMVFFIGKLYFNSKVALSLAFLTGLIPSLSFFALKFDSFYFLLLAISVYLLLRATRSKKYYFYAGFSIFICTFFSYSLIPPIGILLSYFVLLFWKKWKILFDGIVGMTIGFLVPLLVLLIIGYNSFTAFFPIISNQAPRSYWQWVLYNPFDFFHYFGFAMSILFFTVMINLKKIRNHHEIKKLLVLFLLFFIILVVTGVSRAEVGRIWMPLMLFPLLGLGIYKKLSFNMVILLAVLLFIQIVFLTEFWVPIW